MKSSRKNTLSTLNQCAKLQCRAFNYLIRPKMPKAWGNNFEKVMSIPFDQDRFENNLLNIRKESRKQLEVAIKCLEK